MGNFARLPHHVRTLDDQWEEDRKKRRTLTAIPEDHVKLVFNKLQWMEIGFLNCLADLKQRQLMLLILWNARPASVRFEAFQWSDPLWSRPVRLSTALNVFDRSILHKWAQEKNIVSGTYHETFPENQSAEKEKIMFFHAKPSDEEWKTFHSEVVSLEREYLIPNALIA